MCNYTLKIGKSNYLRAASCYVRMEVFVLERNLDIKLEFDENDTPDSVYSVIFDKNRPVATARFLPLNEYILRITRVATLDSYRGNHLGEQVVVALENLGKSQGFKEVIIHSEIMASGFYKALGYIPDGSIYQEDGIDCISLKKKL
ncbi:GNAT family N-acetyltransferase [Enterococcus sp. LJL90]